MPYTVKSGDTLSTIAKKHDVDIAQLLDANPRFKANPNRIRVGDVVNIPGDSVTEPPPAPRPQPQVTPQPQPRADRVLGTLSMRYETGGRGGGTVSSGVGDPGGVSYGSYQMTSKPNGGTVGRFVSHADFPFADRFADLTPGSAEFSTAWKALAASNAEEFQEAQHDYIKRTHFDLLVQKLIDEDGLNVLTRSAALQDVIWSTAVQHGGATTVPGKALSNVELKPEDEGFDKAFITAIYEERGRKGADGVLVRFPRASPQVQQGVADRFRNELKDALKMLEEEG
jgi:murein DD-endopeptidase MepM/ murein hydrolase activator NlpD